MGVVQHGARGTPTAPDVHQRGIRHLAAGGDAGHLVHKLVPQWQFGHVAIEGDEDAQRRVFALAHRVVGATDDVTGLPHPAKHARVALCQWHVESRCGAFGLGMQHQALSHFGQRIARGSLVAVDGPGLPARRKIRERRGC
ncbi:hypothetical protein D3C87_1446580 [compost metagenome]